MRGSTFSRLSLQLLLTDLLLTVLGLLLAAELRARLPFGRGGALPEEVVAVPWLVFPLALVCWGGALLMVGAYDPRRVLRWYDDALRAVEGGTLGTVLMAGVLFLTYREMSRLQFVYFYVVNLLLLLAHRALLRIWYRLRHKPRPGWGSRILILGAGELGQRVARAVLDHGRWGYRLVGYLDDSPSKQRHSIEQGTVLGTLDDLRRVVDEERVDELWIALPPRAVERTKAAILQAETLPVRVKIVPDYLSLATIRAQIDLLSGIPLIGLREPVIAGAARLLKRLTDLAIASLALVLVAPWMAAIVAAIRLDSRGPILFRQTRVGENGRLFEMLKFRTMTADAPARQADVLIQAEDGALLHKRPDDPRVTKVGRFLRRYSLDELPQLINVLKGEMSLVGPRPEQPWLVEKYEPWQRKRFAVPQGITGWWQINGRSDKPMHLNTQDDLYYIYNWSLWLDLWILLRTPLAVLQGKGAF